MDKLTTLEKMLYLAGTNFFFVSFYPFCSEWVLGNREDLAKDIIAELQPESGEVSCNFGTCLGNFLVLMCLFHILF